MEAIGQIDRGRKHKPGQAIPEVAQYIKWIYVPRIKPPYLHDFKPVLDLKLIEEVKEPSRSMQEGIEEETPKFGEV